MPEYNIKYTSRNTYSGMTKEIILEFLVLPFEGDNQTVRYYNYTSNVRVDAYLGKNLFGFQTMFFRLKNFQGEFVFEINISVEKEEVNPFNFIPLGVDEELKLLASEAFLVDNYLFLKQTLFTELPSHFTYPLKETTESVFDFSIRVNEFIHKTFTYSTEINNPKRTVFETIEHGKGVCQDFAHIMLGILRANNIPARYVSGYLNQGELTLGAGAVHAWVQVLMPEIGWIGFDPTNNVLEDHNYIIIAYGTDISDCATLKGVVKGMCCNSTEYDVLVSEQNKKNNQ